MKKKIRHLTEQDRKNLCKKQRFCFKCEFNIKSKKCMLDMLDKEVEVVED